MMGYVKTMVIFTNANVNEASRENSVKVSFDLQIYLSKLTFEMFPHLSTL